MYNHPYFALFPLLYAFLASLFSFLLVFSGKDGLMSIKDALKAAVGDSEQVIAGAYKDNLQARHNVQNRHHAL